MGDLQGGCGATGSLFQTREILDTLVPLVLAKTLRRPGTYGLIAGWGPAASDLTARYKDVRTRLDGLSIVPLFRVSVSVSRGAAIKRYPRRSPGYYRFEPKILPPVSST